MSPIIELDELQDRRTRLLPLTVDQYLQLISTGIIEEGDPYELLNGTVVRKDRSATGEDPMTVGDHHAYCVIKLGKIGRPLERMGCHMRTQQPIVLPPRNMPEPDGAIVTGKEEDYLNRCPAADDVLCVIEVADASLRRDRTTKQRIYANARIPIYMIVNLVDHCVEVRTNPLAGKGRYQLVESFTATQTIKLPAPSGKSLAVQVRKLLP